MKLATMLDPANGKGSEVQELQMLTGSGELMQYSFADGTEPKSMEIMSYAGGTRRIRRPIRAVKRAKPAPRTGPTLVEQYRKKVAQRRPAIVSKARGLVGSGKVAGTLSALSPGMGSSPSTYAPPPPEPTGMSTGAKIGLAVGGMAVLGIVVYAIVKKKNG